jgi:hypothetical protein
MSATKVMKKQHTIADVLHLAADKCLAAHARYGEGGRRKKFSCCSIEEALYHLYDAYYTGEVAPMRRRVLDGLRNMGCNTGSSTLFARYGDPKDYDKINHEVQGMRYMWLKWAALMAEEQGV